MNSSNGALRIGVRLPVTGVAATPENIISVASWAERLGFTSMWASEHIVAPRTVSSTYPGTDNGQWPYPADMKWMGALPALLWAASAAPSCEIGTCVVIVPMYNPVILAKHVATTNLLCGERFLLGVGLGWMSEEFQAIGAEFEQRAAVGVESIALMRALWTGDPVTFEGNFYGVSDVQMAPAPQSGTIPIMWGGRSRAAIRRVVNAGDGWIPDCRSIEDLRGGITYLKEECERAGREYTTIRIVFKPGAAFRVTAENLDELRFLGVDDLVTDPPLTSVELDGCLAEMERVAELFSS